MSGDPTLEKRYAIVDGEKTGLYTIGSVSPQEANSSEGYLIVALPWRPEHSGAWHQFLVRGVHPVRMTRVAAKAKSGFRRMPHARWGEEYYDFPRSFPEINAGEMGDLYENTGTQAVSQIDMNVDAEEGPDPGGPDPAVGRPRARSADGGPDRRTGHR